MPKIMRWESLPQATVYDRTEDPPGSVDPLGTVPGAEQLADLLFPGMTARMWRARHLTFAALAALVAERVSEAMPNGDSSRLEARLAFERLFVAAIARQDREDNGWKQASRRLPGIGLARRARNQPLGRANFLKGQAINGAFGVVSRLARDLGLIDPEDDGLDPNGRSLLAAWARDQHLSGLLDDSDSGGDGVRWMKQLTKKVRDLVEDEAQWPAAWPGWDDFAKRLRPDGIRRFERKELHQQLSNDTSGRRRRMLELLTRQEIVAAYEARADRGVIERSILVDAVLPLVKTLDTDVDRDIALTIRLVDAYEQVAGLLDVAFRGVVWRLSRLRDRVNRTKLLGDRKLAQEFDSISKRLAVAAEKLEKELQRSNQCPQLFESFNRERVEQLRDNANAASHGSESLVKQVLDRHHRVQKQKEKRDWIDSDGEHLTLLGGGDQSAEMPSFDGRFFLHPFRVVNAYSFLSDLKQVQFAEATDDEEN